MTVIYILAVYKVYIYICLYVVGTGSYTGPRYIYPIYKYVYISIRFLSCKPAAFIYIYKDILYNKIMIFKNKIMIYK